MAASCTAGGAPGAAAARAMADTTWPTSVPSPGRPLGVESPVRKAYAMRRCSVASAGSIRSGCPVAQAACSMSTNCGARACACVDGRGWVGAQVRVCVRGNKAGEGGQQ